MANIRVVAGIAVSGRKLFIARRSPNKSLAGLWEFPGGKVEAGELPIAALKREIIEEIGDVTAVRKIIPLEHFTSDNEKFEYHTYLIPIAEEFIPQLNHEHRGYAWTSIEDHPKPLHPGVWRTFNFASVLDKIKTLENIL